MKNLFRVVKQKAKGKVLEATMPAVVFAVDSQGDKKLKRWVEMINRPLNGDFCSEVIRFWGNDALKAFKKNIVGNRGPLVEGIIAWIETELVPHLCEKRLSSDDRKNLEEVIRPFILSSWDNRYNVVFQMVKEKVDKEG